MINFEQQTSQEIMQALSARVKQRRKERGLTQAQLARKAGMSLASYKRFEQTGLISLESLVKISIALDAESDFDGLFARKEYSSIQEVIREGQSKSRNS